MTIPTSVYVLESVFVIVALYVLVPSERRKYSVTDCPIFPENVTRNVGPVTSKHEVPVSEMHTFVAYVPSGFLIPPVTEIACDVAVVVGFGVSVIVGFDVGVGATV